MTIDTSPEDSPPAAHDPDVAIRRLATRHLAANVKIGAGLVAHCRQMVHDAGNGDHLGPLSAAARLINSNARMAHALGLIALVERRNRTIIERIQPPKSELNSENEKKAPYRTRNEIRADIGRKWDEMVAQSRREQLKHPIDPQEEANLTLQEEEWMEERESNRRALKTYSTLGRALHGKPPREPR
jgi:hypothetical protein